jgi:ribosomal protein L40E
VRLSDFHLHQIGGSQSVVSFASVNPYSLRSFFHLSPQRYPPRMGSHGRRQPETRMVPVLVCRACGGLTSSARFSYLCERLLCDRCGAENPQINVRSVQTRDIFVRFITTDGCSVQAVDLNLDRPLGPRVPVTSPEVLRRLLAYLGANHEALCEYDRSHQSHGKGNVRIMLQPGRKNLLRLRN